MSCGNNKCDCNGKGGASANGPVAHDNAGWAAVLRDIARNASYTEEMRMACSIGADAIMEEGPFACKGDDIEARIESVGKKADEVSEFSMRVIDAGLRSVSAFVLASIASVFLLPMDAASKKKEDGEEGKTQV